MPRPKLAPGEKRINVSFTLTEYIKDQLESIIEPGHRSEWIASVVTKAVNREIKKRND